MSLINIPNRIAVLHELLQGLSDKQIGSILGMSMRMVKWYEHLIYDENNLFREGCRVKLVILYYTSGVKLDGKTYKKEDIIVG